MLRPPWAPPAVSEECSHRRSRSVFTRCRCRREFGQLQCHFPGRLQSHREVPVSHRGGADPILLLSAPPLLQISLRVGLSGWVNVCILRTPPPSESVEAAEMSTEPLLQQSDGGGVRGAELPWQVGAWARGGGQCPGGMENRSVCGPGASTLSGTRLRMTKMEGETEGAESLGCDGQGQG